MPSIVSTILRGQIRLLNPIIVGATLEQSRRGQDALGRIGSRAMEGSVHYHDVRFSEFDAAWAVPLKGHVSRAILYLHGGGIGAALPDCAHPRARHAQAGRHHAAHPVVVAARRRLRLPPPAQAQVGGRALASHHLERLVQVHLRRGRAGQRPHHGEADRLRHQQRGQGQQGHPGGGTPGAAHRRATGAAKR